MNFVDRLLSIVESDLDDESVRILTLLCLKEGVHVGDLLSGKFPNVIASLSRLENDGLLEADGAVLTACFKRKKALPAKKVEKVVEEVKGRPVEKEKPKSRRRVKIKPFSIEDAREAIQNPGKRGSRAAIEKGIDWLVSKLSREREDRGAKRLSTREIDRNRRELEDILRLFLESGATWEEFVDFAVKKTKFMKRLFPTLKTLSGDWFREEWENRAPEEKIQHAGHEYADVQTKSLRENLSRHGVEGLSDEDVDHINSLIEMQRECPDFREAHEDERIEKAIVEIAKEKAK